MYIFYVLQEWGNAERLMAVDELITLCEPTQVRHMMQVIEPQFQRDFISLLPKEVIPCETQTVCIYRRLCHI